MFSTAGAGGFVAVGLFAAVANQSKIIHLEDLAAPGVEVNEEIGAVWDAVAWLVVVVVVGEWTVVECFNQVPTDFKACVFSCVRKNKGGCC